MPHSSSEPSDGVLRGPSNQQTPPDDQPPLALQPILSTSSSNVASPLGHNLISSQDASSIPLEAVRDPPLLISSSSGSPHGSPRSTTVGTSNLNALNPPPQDQPHQLPWYPESSGSAHAGLITSAPMTPFIAPFRPPPFQQPPFNAFASVPPSLAAPHTPYSYPWILPSQSHNVHPNNQISLSSATPRIGPNPSSSRMPLQASPSNHLTNPALPNSQVNQLASSYPQPNLSTSGEGVIPPNPDRPSRRPLSYAPQPPINPELHPSRVLSTLPQTVQKEASFVANDPFSSRNRKRSNTAFKNDVTFDEIRVTPNSAPEAEESAAQQYYMTPSNSYPAAYTFAPPNAPQPVNVPLPTTYAPPQAHPPFHHPPERPLD